MSDVKLTALDDLHIHWQALIDRYYPGGHLPPVRPLGNLEMLRKLPPTMSEPGSFVVSGQAFRAAMVPEVRRRAEWGERLYHERTANHDPGDEDRSER